MNPNNSKENMYLMIWLEQYKQANEYIRNYRSIHWQIASVLYILMGAIIGYALPNIEGTGGKILACISTALIFSLHLTTYYYFKKVEKIKKDDQKYIKQKIVEIIILDNQDTTKECFLEYKNTPMCCFWKYHPEWGFFIIFTSLVLLAVAFWCYPKP